MASLSRAAAMTAKVDGERAKAMLRHSLRKTFVASGMLAKAVDDSEGYPGAGKRPRAVGDLRAVGRRYEPAGGRGHLSRQGARTLSGS